MQTLDEAKRYLRANWEKGVSCPCCGQHVQLYRYKLFATSALALIELYKLHRKKPREEYFHVSQFAEASETKQRSPHFAELRFWGLVVPIDRKTREKNASGYWQITEKGKEFVEGRVSVPKYVRLYNNKFVRLEGQHVTIQEALGNQFNYIEILGFTPETVKQETFL